MNSSLILDEEGPTLNLIVEVGTAREVGVDDYHGGVGLHWGGIIGLRDWLGLGEARRADPKGIVVMTSSSLSI